MQMGEQRMSWPFKILLEHMQAHKHSWCRFIHESLSNCISLCCSLHNCNLDIEATRQQLMSDHRQHKYETVSVVETFRNWIRLKIFCQRRAFHDHKRNFNAHVGNWQLLCSFWNASRCAKNLASGLMRWELFCRNCCWLKREQLRDKWLTIYQLESSLTTQRKFPQAH